MRVIKRAKTAVKSELANLSDLRLAADAAWHAGLWGRSLELMELLPASDSSQGDDPYTDRFKAVSILRDRGVTFELVETLHTAVYGFLADRGVRIAGTSLYIDESPGDQTIFVTIEVAESEDVTRKLDEELTEVLFSAVDVVPLGTFSIDLGAQEPT